MLAGGSQGSLAPAFLQSEEKEEAAQQCQDSALISSKEMLLAFVT